MCFREGPRSILVASDFEQRGRRGVLAQGEVNGKRGGVGGSLHPIKRPWGVDG